MSNNVNAGRDFHKVMLVGAAGRGKTYSFRNMDEQVTGFLNIEDKPLPFKKRFQFHARPVNVASVFKALEDYALNPLIEVIVIDSFSAFCELLLAQARKEKKGFDIWNLYNEEIGRFLTLIKRIKKEVFVTAHYEMLNIEGDAEKRIKVKGKEWEGLIEKEFTVVLYADNTVSDDKFDYFFRLRGEGISAKCPPDIFGENVTKVKNDCYQIYKAILEFVS